MNERTALVTGASGGLGAALARELAARGYRLALAARSVEAMERLAAALGEPAGAAPFVHGIDLSQPGSAAALVAALDDAGIAPDLLVNNAGVGIAERFVAHDPARLAAMLHLNIVSLTELSWALGRRMAARGRGHILMVASLAAYQPDPLLAAYGASKAYVLSLGEAIGVELAPAVGVTVLSPGLMDTGFNAASGYRTGGAMRRLELPVERVAKIGLDALFAGKGSVVAGRRNAAMALAARLLPRRFAARQAYRMSGGDA